MKTKTCFRCGRSLPITEFYAHPMMSDGHLNKCKECTKADSVARREQHPERDLDTRLKACAKKPTSKNAHMAIDAAVRAGRIIKPKFCSGCGCPDTEHRIEAHHYDYSKPLDVIWLCTPCHRRMDARKHIREGLKPYGGTGHGSRKRKGNNL